MLSSLCIRGWQASAERLVNGNEGGRSSRLAGGEPILRFEQCPFGVEHTEKIRDASFETLMCQ
jgi:hypothetical protein